MDDLDNKNNDKTNSSGENRQSSPDPVGQTSDDHDIPLEKVQPAEVIQNVKMPIPVTDSTLSPNRYTGTGEDTQAVSSVGNIIASMLRFKLMIFLVFLIVSAPAIFAIWTQVVPKYRARAELRVRPIIPYLVFQTEESGAIPLYDSFVHTQVSIIRSSAVLQRVLDQLEVQETGWYKNPPKSLVSRLRGTTPSPLDRLGDALSAKPRKQTEIIDVAFIDSNPKEAQLITNAVLDQYISYIEEMSDETGDKIYSQLVEQYKSLENEILGREKVIAGLRRKLGTESPGELISGKRVRLDQTQARLDQLQQNITLLEWDIKRSIADDSNDIPKAVTDNVQKLPKYYEDEEWRKLDASVKAIRFEIDNSLLRADHPDMVPIKRKLEFAEEQLRRREEQLNEQQRDQDKVKIPPGVSSTVAGAGSLSYEEGLKYMEYQLDRLKREEQLLVDELKKQQAEFAGLFENAQLLDAENNALQHKRELFSAVRQRLDQKTMERNVPGSIEVLTRASVSSGPYNDRRVVLTVMVLVFALGLGSGLAYLRADRHQAIYTPMDMPNQMQAPFLGYIPVTPVKGYLDNETSSVMFESIRIVRTALLSRLNGQNSSTILVTSASEGTGKTTFTMMLGKSLAQAGKKILVIDADFKKMSLTQQFEDMYNSPGFVQALREPSKYKENIFEAYDLDFDLMPAGKLIDDKTVPEEIANGAFKLLIDKLRTLYDVILLDSSPVLPVADATILSSQVDGIIMVERENISYRSDIVSALTRLGSARGCLLGTVFLGSGNKQYGYGYGYGYGHK